MIALVKKIAHREGIGNILAEGTAKAAALIGKEAEAYAIHVKGLEIPAYEPRGAKSHGYNYATASIGASHTYGYARQEIFGRTIPRAVNRFAETENADIVIYNQERTAVTEVGICCTFANGWTWFDELFHKMLEAATGIKEFGDYDFLWKVGERTVNLERAFNIREGFGRKDDTLPQRMLKEPLHTGDAPGEGERFRELDQFLDKYYELRGWTKEGIPSEKKLKELGLDYAI
jgi:aldehyde:ferredoxin oxidoreductase